MTSGAPWSVKGIDPKAREVAKDLARRSGMTLGEWLNRMILEDEGPEDVTSQDQFADRSARSYLQASRGAGAPARYEAAGDDVTRAAGAVERLTARMEQAETRMGLAITGVEHSVREALARIEAGEREQISVAARFEGAVETINASQASLSERLRRFEAETPQTRSEALRSLEQALGKVAGHLYDGENRTRAVIDAVVERVERIEQREGADPSDLAGAGRLGARLAEAEAKTAGALEGLRASFAALDGRLKAVEGGSAGGDLRLEDLAASLSQRVEAAREEIAEKLLASADQRFDSMEHKLGEVARQVDAAEHRSARAIEQMGREVMTVAENLNRRVASAEQRSAEAIEQVGGEMSRVAAAVENRLGRSENVHAEALERLSGEIARITERLGERIGAAERRSAQAIDEVGEQVVRVTDRLNQRHERASQELSDRIRQSEERTARLLEEARERIDQQLDDVRRSPASPSAQAQAPAPRSVFSPFGAAFPEIGPAEPDQKLQPAEPPPPLGAFPAADAAPKEQAFGLEDFEAAEAFEPDDAFDLDEPFEPKSAFEPAAEFEAAVPEEPDTRAAVEASVDSEPGLGRTSAADDPFPGDVFAGETEFLPSERAVPESLFDEAEDEAAAVDAAFEPEQRESEAEPPLLGEGLELEPQPVARPLTTREIIEQARAAARANSLPGGEKRADAGKKGFKAGGGLSLRPSLDAVFSGLGRGRGKRRQNTMQTALLIAGGAAFLSVGAAGLVVMSAKPGGAPPKRVADAIERERDGTEMATEQDAPAFGDNPRAAIALSPQLLGPARPLAPSAPSPEVVDAYQQGVRALEAGEPGGLEAVRKAANLSYAPAQRFLAKVNETGAHGAKMDLASARRWMERAAQGGDRGAMHDVALYYIRGVGGQKDPSGAAQWFRRAADLGLVDSQYNLGVLYEKGIGVPQNAAEAYKWFLVAGRSGDLEARQSAQRVRGALSSEGQAVAERTAAGYRAAVAGVAASGANADATATAQQALSRLGFYQGPRDGRSSTALSLAIAAYQREQGLPATGALDQITLARLAVFTR